MAIRRMRNAGWIILIVFPRHKLLRERASMLRCMYVACHVHCFGEVFVIIGVQLVPVFAGVVCGTSQNLRHLLEQVTVIYSSYLNR